MRSSIHIISHLFILYSCFFVFNSFGQQPLNVVQDSKSLLGVQHEYPVYDIEIDTNGYIYATGGNTILRMNGSSFTTLELGFTEKSSIDALYKGHDEQIWFSRMNGDLGYIYQEKIIDFSCPISLNWKRETRYENIYKDSANALHLAPRGKGYVSWTNGVLRRTTYDDLNGIIIKKLEDGNWFHFSQYNKDKPHLSLYILDSNGTPNEIAQFNKRSYYQSSLVAHQDGSLSISIGDSSIFRIKNGELIESYKFEGTVIKLFVDDQNNLWIGTLRKGFFKAKNSDLSQLEHSGINGAASVLTQDCDGGLWFNSDSLSFGRIPSSNVYQYSDRTGHPMLSDNVSVVSYGDSIIVTNRFKQSYVIFEESVKPLDVKGATRSPIQILYDSLQQDLWFTFPGFLERHKNGEKLTIPFLDSSFRDKRTFELIMSQDGRIYGRTKYEIYEVKNQTIVKISEKPSPQILDFETDLNGNIWLTQKDGIWVLNEGQFERPQIDLPDLFLKPNCSIVRALDALWIYDQSEIYYIRDNKPVLFYHEENSGINASTIAQDGSLWLLSELHQKIYVIREQDNAFQIKHLQFDHFVRTLPRADRQLLAVKENNIYLATLDGLIVLNEAQLLKNKIPLKTTILEVLINTEKSTLTQSYELAHNENNLTINFDAISYYGLPIQYNYQLEGQDEHWTTTTHPQIQYTNIAPGTYRFMVRAGIPYNGWSEPQTILFYIAPPYWETSWFRIVMILSVTCLLTILLFILRKRAATKRKLLFEMNHNRQLALRKSMNPHFIYNALNSIQSFVIQNDMDRANNFISKFGNLMRDYVEANVNETISIAEEMTISDRYVGLEEARLKKQISLRYSVAKGINIQTYMLPPFTIQPLVENAIWHGLAHKKGPLKIDIKFTLKNNKLIIEIKDNGIGITEKSSLETTHSSEILMKRLELLSQQYRTKFTFDRRNLVGDNCEISGCIVTFTLPKIILNERINY